MASFYKGALQKKAAGLGRDRVRFFELFGTTLTYYEAEGGRQIGTVDMTHGEVSEKGNQSVVLKGPHMRREYQLVAKTTEERDEWFAALTHAAEISRKRSSTDSTSAASPLEGTPTQEEGNDVAAPESCQEQVPRQYTYSHRYRYREVDISGEEGWKEECVDSEDDEGSDMEGTGEDVSE